jgi:hypothetical protein
VLPYVGALIFKDLQKRVVFFTMNSSFVITLSYVHVRPKITFDQS